MLDLPAEGVCDEAHAALEEIEEAMRSARGADVPPSVARKIDGVRPAAPSFCVPSSHAGRF